MRLDRSGLVCLLLAWVGPALAADEPRHRFEAPIAVAQPAPFIALPLPPAVYARSLQPDLADLRVVDSQGERVPFALLGFRDAAVESREQTAAVAMYALPKSASGRAGLPDALDVVVQHDRIELRQRRNGIAPDAASAGWLFDLGERKDKPSPSSLRLHWAGPAEFSSAFRIETSDDLRAWRRAGGGQLMALRGPDGNALTQPLVPLPDQAGRFVRLAWAEPAKAPRVDAAAAVIDTQTSVARDAPLRMTLRASIEPAGKVAAEPRAMHIDLGGVLPLARLELNLPPGSTTVMPLRVQQRNRVDEAWQTVAQGVAYRIERGDGAADRSPPLALGNLRARYLRLLPDERAPAFDAARTEAVVELRLATLVFAAQGRAPYRLLAGAAGTQATGALTPEALVPKLDQERPRFGAATLGAFSEVAEVAQAAQRAETVALWRPRLLWAVLLAGVAGLGWMVWRLAVQRGGAGR